MGASVTDRSDLSPAMLEALQEELEADGSLNKLRQAAERGGANPENVIRRYMSKLVAESPPPDPKGESTPKQTTGRKPSTDRPSGFPEMTASQSFGIASLYRLSGGNFQAIRVAKLYPEMSAIGDPFVPVGKKASSYANNVCRGLERRGLVVMERSQSGKMIVVKAKLTGAGLKVAKEVCRKLGIDPSVGDPLMPTQEDEPWGESTPRPS